MDAGRSAPTLTRVLTFTVLAMLAFAANSLLCRLALKHSAIDPASFTGLRLVSGAVALALIVRGRRLPHAAQGDWLSAAALFIYAACFSWAYVSLPASTGALLLFGAVQVTMIGWGRWRGERFAPLQTFGLAIACGGLSALLLPGAQAAPWQGSVLMLTAGLAWGIYSLRGRGVGDPLGATAGNFRRAALLAVPLCAALLPWAAIDAAGALYAVVSGALASGVGYAIWYAAVRGLTATTAAAVQLSVPAIAALGAATWLGEPITLGLLLTSALVLGGVGLVLAGQPRSHNPSTR